MSSFPLPLECLQLILQQLADERATLALLSLLRVNRYICYATVAYLYNDPFFPNFCNGSGSMFRLACTLLRQVPPKRISKLLRVMLLEWIERQDKETKVLSNEEASIALDTLSITHIEHSSKTYVPVIDYLPYIRQLDYRGFDFMGLVNSFWEDEHTASRIQRLNLEEVYRADFEYLVARGFIERDEKEAHLQQTLAWDLQRDMVFAFCHPESIQNLTIPLSDIGRYLGVVERFNSLSSVSFLVDIHLNKPEATGEQQLSTEDTARPQGAAYHHIPVLEDMVGFVKNHTAVHRNILKYAFCLATPAQHIYQELCPEEYQIRLFECLPPLQSPRVLNSKNWLQFVAGSEEIDLGSVEVFDGDHRWKDRLPPNGLFLSRCRSLKEINTGGYGRVSFEWAVEEKKQRFTAIKEGTSPKPLTPVQIVQTTSNPGCIQHDIQDPAYAFSDTLRVLMVNNLLSSKSTPSTAQPLNIGQGWFLPQLRALVLVSVDAPLKIAPDTFRGCLALEIISLKDGVAEYNTQDIQTWRPAELPNLTELTLEGIPAASFHPSILHSTPRLEYLEIQIHHDSYECYIPRVEELVAASRPLWSWDWHLPHLTTITLSAEFAYRFQFRMLQGCPSLESLSLDLFPRTTDHARVLHIADLVCTSTEQSVEESQQQEHHVQVPKLRNLDIVGQWHFQDHFLSTLLQRVTPNITGLNIGGCSGYDLKGLVDASRDLRKLRYCMSSVEMDEEDVKQAGLVKGWQAEEEYSQVIEFSLDPGIYYHIRP
ncbi:hypothetical protein BGX28_010000 [Mortierella sp. GBA30]|nr:hypothetical protein BGX28_010000 [Mortierella sp. GBA30]